MVGDYMTGSDKVVPTIAAALTGLLALEVRKTKYSFSEVTSKGEIATDCCVRLIRITSLNNCGPCSAAMGDRKCAAAAAAIPRTIGCVLHRFQQSQRTEAPAVTLSMGPRCGEARSQATFACE